jgi:hypothetical protein
MKLQNWFSNWFSKPKIFVQIASYRDPELVPTLDSLFSNATHPDRLVIAIVWQRDETESLHHYTDHPQVKVVDIPYSESKGVCWARNKLKDLYNGEKYTLHLDSHHRFIKGWDEECINMLTRLQAKGHKKPLITSYLPSYNPATDERVYTPWKLAFQRFLPEGPAFPIPHTIDEYESLTEPIRGRFYSGHFAFTLGSFCKEVPHDPNLYFHGEEPSLAVRAYTWGYDIFYPHKVLAWHEYTREGKKKHWDDNPWVDENNGSFKRYRKLMSMDGEKYDPQEFGIYGLGPIRSLGDYIRFTGVDVSRRTIQQYALDTKEPPGPTFSSEEEYKNSFLPFHKYVINLHKNDIEGPTDFDVWAIAIKDKDKNDIVRLDIGEEEINSIIAQMSGDWMHIWKEWYSTTPPAYWAVWPHSKTQGWLNLIERPL